MRKWLPLLAVCLGTFMLLVDVTIVNVALPAMSIGLDVSFSSLQWVIDGYALSLAALLLVAGAAADRFGRRRAYVVGLVLFAAASSACGLAPDAGPLVVARLVQGVGAAAMYAATAALLAGSYSGRDRGTAFGVWGAVNGAAAACGPVLGGLLTQGLSWRWIFLVNVPVALVTVVLTLRVVPESRHATGRIDVVGACAFTAFAAGAVYGLITGGDDGWGRAPALTGFAVAVVALVAFLIIEPRRANPLLDLTLFRKRTFSILVLTAVVMQASAFGPLAYVSIWLQSLLGLGPIRAGLVVLPLSVAAFIVSALLGRVLHGRSPRLPVGIGMVLIGAGDLLVVTVGPESGWSTLVPGLVVLGLGVGAGTPVLVSAVIEAVPGQRAGMAGGVVNTFRQLGMALGIAVLGALFTTRVTATVTAVPDVPDPVGVADGLARGGAQAILAAVPLDARPALKSLAHTAFAAGLDRIFLVAGLAALVVGVLVLLVLRPVPAPTGGVPQPTPAGGKADPTGP